jgi:hypothetical protein
LLAGVFLVLLGLGWLLDTLGVSGIDWDLILPAALILVGVGLAVAARQTTGHGGLIALGIVLTVVLSVGTLVELPFGGGVGDRQEHPRSFDAVDEPFELMMGKLTVDLSELSSGSGTTTIRARVGIGQLVVIVPVGADPAVRGEAGIGEVQILGESEGGLGVKVDHPAGVSDPGYRLDLSVGIGEVQVVEEGEAP